jgi:hypothetical protein
MYLNEYYWDVLYDKYDITTDRGFSKFEDALESWFRRNHKVELVNFGATTSQGIPLSSEIQIEVPADRLGIPSGLSWEEFVDLIEGPDEDKYKMNDAGLNFVVGLLDTKRTLSGWDMQQHPDNPDIVVITYFLG